MPLSLKHSVLIVSHCVLFLDDCTPYTRLPGLQGPASTPPAQSCAAPTCVLPPPIKPCRGGRGRVFLAWQRLPAAASFLVRLSCLGIATSRGGVAIGRSLVLNWLRCLALFRLLSSLFPVLILGYFSLLFVWGGSHSACGLELQLGCRSRPFLVCTPVLHPPVRCLPCACLSSPLLGLLAVSRLPRQQQHPVQSLLPRTPTLCMEASPVLFLFPFRPRLVLPAAHLFRFYFPS